MAPYPNPPNLGVAFGSGVAPSILSRMVYEILNGVSQSSAQSPVFFRTSAESLRWLSVKKLPLKSLGFDQLSSQESEQLLDIWVETEDKSHVFLAADNDISIHANGTQRWIKRSREWCCLVQLISNCFQNLACHWCEDGINP